MGGGCTGWRSRRRSQQAPQTASCAAGTVAWASSTAAAAEIAGESTMFAAGAAAAASVFALVALSETDGVSAVVVGGGSGGGSLNRRGAAGARTCTAQSRRREEEEEAAMNTGDASESSAAGIPLIPGNASLLGWAMSSLTLKGKASDNAPLASVNSNTSVTPATSDVSSGFRVLSHDSEISGLLLKLWILKETRNVASLHASSSVGSMEQVAPPSPTSTDGWGEVENGIFHEDHDSDKEGWDDVEPLEEQKPTSSLANIQAAQKHPVVQTRPQVTSSMRPKSKTVQEDDEDDDPWGSVAVPAPKSSSRSTDNLKSASSRNNDDPWASVAVPAPRTASRPLNTKPAAVNDDSDPWAAIAAPPPTTKVKPLSLGRGRGKAAPAKLGAQRIDRTS
ncbi:hypothetical protein Taro_017747 [Colocasia esculenta]|uniref:Uncharacterized protein n=1 Tax=Colocasia esculenta TaxID=4460 RepID=A0A843UU59_COLES|nr:hypothetical protein [Colocasia esculenta]